MPEAQFWVWLPSLVGLFAGIVLVLSSVDLRRFGAFPYWNGIIRLALVAIFGLPRVLRCGHGDLLRNRLQPMGAVA